MICSVTNPSLTIKLVLPLRNVPDSIFSTHVQSSRYQSSHFTQPIDVMSFDLIARLTEYNTKQVFRWSTLFSAFRVRVGVIAFYLISFRILISVSRDNVYHSSIGWATWD